MDFNILATLASLIAGIIYFIPGEILYRTLYGNVPGPITIAAYFLGLALCVFIVILILSKALGNYRHVHYTFNKLIAMVLALTIVGVPLVSAGCEFLYELGISDSAKPKNYVFLVDNSISMLDNDPSNQRFDVVEQVANTLPADTNVGVYVFADQTASVFGIGQAIPGSITIPPEAIISDGNTALYGCICDVANELTPDMQKSATKFIVLTDGAPTDGEHRREAIRICNDKNIAVSCVGFGNYFTSTFEDLANRTGGNFMPASDVSQLASNVEEVINKNPVNRNLISSRNDATSNSTLYAILRVLFLCIIGFVFAYLKYLNAALSKFSPGFFIACLASSLIGGILVEVLYQMYLFELFGRLALCLTFAFTPLLSNSYYSQINAANTRTSHSSTGGGNLYGGSSGYSGSGKNYF